MRTRKSQITEKLPGFVLLRHEQLNEFTYDDSLGYWKDHVERKKALFKDVVRANVWAYNNTFKKFHKEGHAGTKLAGRHSTALGLQKKRLNDSIKLFNKEFPQVVDQLSWDKMINPSDRFWGVQVSDTADLMIELNIAKKENELIRRELYNLFCSITNEAKAWEEAKGLFANNVTNVIKGYIAFYGKNLEAVRRWKEGSLFAFKRIQANPSIDYSYGRRGILFPSSLCGHR
ncbi:unnamed protein product [Mucor hiemalis]